MKVKSEQLLNLFFTLFLLVMNFMFGLVNLINQRIFSSLFSAVATTFVLMYLIDKLKGEIK